MKKVVIMLILMLMLVANVCWANTFQTEIYGVDKKAIEDQISLDMSRFGYIIDNSSEYQISFSKEITDFNMRLIYGNPLSIKILCNFIPHSNWTKVVIDDKLIRYSHATYKVYQDASDNDWVSYLNSLSMYFNGSFGTGISWESSKIDNAFVVYSVDQYSSAEKSKIVKGDLITAVNGVSSKNIDNKKMRELMRGSGKEGSEIKLTIKRLSEEFPVTVIYGFIPPAYNPDKYVRPN